MVYDICHTIADFTDICNYVIISKCVNTFVNWAYVTKLSIMDLAHNQMLVLVC